MLLAMILNTKATFNIINYAKYKVFLACIKIVYIFNKLLFKLNLTSVIRISFDTSMRKP